MSSPPKYPRIAHLVPSNAASSDDLVLSPDARTALLETEVVVEEKLDGMNVMIWSDRGAPQVGMRGGPGASDRSGERGRVKVWAGSHADKLIAGLGSRYVLYGEWLRRRHGVAYDRLPTEFLGFDVLDRRAGGFLGVDDRDALLVRMEVVKPPQLFRGRLTSVQHVNRFVGTSGFADVAAEGVVIRTVDGRAPRVAKVISPQWSDIGSTAWSGENRLVPGLAA